MTFEPPIDILNRLNDCLSRIYWDIIIIVLLIIFENSCLSLHGDDDIYLLL